MGVVLCLRALGPYRPTACPADLLKTKPKQQLPGTLFKRGRVHAVQLVLACVHQITIALGVFFEELLNQRLQTIELVSHTIHHGINGRPAADTSGAAADQWGPAWQVPVFFFLVLTKMSWRSPLTSQYSR